MDVAHPEHQNLVEKGDRLPMSADLARLRAAWEAALTGHAEIALDNGSGASRQESLADREALNSVVLIARCFQHCSLLPEGLHSAELLDQAVKSGTAYETVKVTAEWLLPQEVRDGCAAEEAVTPKALEHATTLLLDTLRATSTGQSACRQSMGQKQTCVLLALARLSCCSCQALDLVQQSLDNSILQQLCSHLDSLAWHGVCALGALLEAVSIGSRKSARGAVAVAVERVCPCASAVLDSPADLVTALLAVDAVGSFLSQAGGLRGETGARVPAFGGLRGALLPWLTNKAGHGYGSHEVLTPTMVRVWMLVNGVRARGLQVLGVPVPLALLCSCLTPPIHGAAFVQRMREAATQSANWQSAVIPGAVHIPCRPSFSCEALLRAVRDSTTVRQQMAAMQAAHEFQLSTLAKHLERVELNAQVESSRLAAELAAVQEEAARLREEVTSLSESSATLREQLQHAQAAHAHAAQALERQTALLDAAETEVFELKAGAQDLRAQLELQADAAQAAGAEVARLGEQLSAAKERAVVAEQRASEAKAKARSEHSKARERSRAVRAEVAALRRHLGDLEHGLQSAESQLSPSSQGTRAVHAVSAGLDASASTVGAAAACVEATPGSRRSASASPQVRVGTPASPALPRWPKSSPQAQEPSDAALLPSQHSQSPLLFEAQSPSPPLFDAAGARARRRVLFEDCLSAASHITSPRTPAPRVSSKKKRRRHANKLRHVNPNTPPSTSKRMHPRQRRRAGGPGMPRLVLQAVGT